MLCGDGDWLRNSNPPGPSRLMRYQAKKELPLVNRWHESVELTPDGRRALTDVAARLDETTLMRAGLLV
jgi:hypothetical protein